MDPYGLKALTHDVFSVGVCLYLVTHDAPASSSSLTLVVFAVWLSLAVNGIIDGVGHGRRGTTPVRSHVTHSVFTAPVWGATTAGVSVYLLETMVLRGALAAELLVTVVSLGVIVAYSHLLLDAFTEGGVFYWRRRIALAHMRYNNLALNTLFLALGATLLLVATLR